jgi:hypothetical protein
MKISVILLLIFCSAGALSQSIEITSPKVNAEYELGDRISITWKDVSGVSLDSVNIFFSLNNGEWQTITRDYQPGKVKGWYDWQTNSDWESGNYKIKIETLYGNKKDFIPDGSFSLRKKAIKDIEEPEISWPIILSQGFLKRNPTLLYYFTATFEPIYYWCDNTIGAGLNLGAVYKNPVWSGQIGPTLNIRVVRDFPKFENIILGKIYWTTSFLFQNSNTKILQTGLLIDARLNINLRYGRDFWKNEWYLISGIGIDLTLIF